MQYQLGNFSREKEIIKKKKVTYGSTVLEMKNTVLEIKHV